MSVEFIPYLIARNDTRPHFVAFVGPLGLQEQRRFNNDHLFISKFRFYLLFHRLQYQRPQSCAQRVQFFLKQFSTLLLGQAAISRLSSILTWFWNTIELSIGRFMLPSSFSTSLPNSFVMKSKPSDPIWYIWWPISSQLMYLQPNVCRWLATDDLPHPMAPVKPIMYGLLGRFGRGYVSIIL